MTSDVAAPAFCTTLAVNTSASEAGCVDAQRLVGLEPGGEGCVPFRRARLAERQHPVRRGEADAALLRDLIEQKWTALTDDERVDLLIRGPQWRREGVHARVAPDEAARLEGLADMRWASTGEEEKIELLAGLRLAGAREDVLDARERDADQTARLLQIANERANERVRQGIDAWQREHPGRGYSTAAQYRSGPSARVISDFWQDYADEAPLRCFSCDWTGRTADGSKELGDGLFHVACPRCSQMLLVVSYPSVEQTKLAASRGNAAARAELDRIGPEMPKADAISTEELEVDPVSDTYEFCRAPNGALGRRRVLGPSRIAVCGELYVPSLSRWRLAAAVLSEADYSTISGQQATELVAGDEAMSAACPDPADLAPHGGRDSKERLDWLHEAIATTITAIRSEEQEVETELPWARPGTWDYDFEIDAIAWIKLAYQTLQSLFEEKQSLLARQGMRDRAEYGDT